MTAPHSGGVDLSQPQQQSPIAIIADLFNLNALQGLVPFFIIGLRQGALVLGGLIVLGLVVILGFSALGWKFTTYWVEGDHLVLQKGVLNRKRTQVPLDRIQQIATEQGIVQQVFGVRKVRVDSAGSAGSEIQLSAITDEMVSELRQQLVGVDRVGTAAPPSGPAAVGTPGAEAAGPPMPAPNPTSMIPASDLRTMVLHHKLADLARIGIARPSPQIIAGVFAILSLGVGGLLDRVSDSLVVGVTGAVVAGVLGLGAILALVIGGTILREFDLTVWRSDQGLRLTAGLLNKRELFARTERVQYVRREQNVLERKLNRTTVFLPQASASANDTSTPAAQTFWVPGAPNEKLADITDLFLPAERPEPSRPIAPKAQQRWFLWGGIIPGLALGLVGLAFLWGSPQFMAPVFWVAGLGVTGWGYLVARVSYRNYGWNVDQNALSRREGFVARKRIDVACRKLQSVKLRQGWWQRRHDVASVECGTAAGSFTILHLPVTTAQHLRDELLYLVETNDQDWM